MTNSERAERALTAMISAMADHVGGIEEPGAAAPLRALQRELVELDTAGREEFLCLLAGKAVCSVVAGAMVAATRDGVPLLQRIYGHDTEDDTMTTNDTPRPKVETRLRDGFDAACVGSGWPGMPACTRRPVVVADGAHRCEECFRTWAGPHKFRN